ncbi:MAG: SDR family NAD(P)-dependent oxidoreductase [Desulfamplus sp.]|nr:SDR family NAD(P)-dependent oxidoreductase [Desulfamplus sp.]
MTTKPNDPTDTLKKLYITLKQTQGKLASIESAAREPIAVIGMGCRFPGGADSPEKYWELLIKGKDAITDVPSNRWNAADWLDPDPDVQGKMFTAKGGFLDQPVDMFDAAFFNISPKEAAGLDPQQRLLLEVSRETFENAGIAPSTLKSSACGVFLGMSSDDYALAHRHSGNHKVIDAYSITGTTFSTACGRISYIYGLEGPSITVDTACSSALGAVHLACRSLRSRESDLALAGGVNLILSPESHICFSKLRAISPDGCCKSFSADANGYVRGEGCGFVLLKRLSDAVADNDRILAVIRGSAMNQDGKSNGLTAPSGPAQEKVILSALKDAGLSPVDIGFIETHGTGTALGDPIEAEALTSVFAQNISSNSDKIRDKKLILGSCKTNIGHLEPASGVAALIKAVLCVNNGKIPPNLHFNTPSPFIPWDDLPIEVPKSTVHWDNSERERIAGVNAFGFSGTNVHVIVGEAPKKSHKTQNFEDKKNEQSNQFNGVALKKNGNLDYVEPSHYILPVSAKTESSAKQLQDQYIKFLKENSSLNPFDICRTSAQGRDHFPYRVAAVGADFKGLIKSLESQSPVQTAVKPALAFLFTGQGSQYPGMGRTLFETQPVFRKTLETCNEILMPLIGESLISMLYDIDSPSSGDPDRLHQTRFTQPALFAVEYALYTLWRSFGIEPDFMMGHSVGEYVAACAAGLFSLEDGLKLISRRGELMQSLPSGGGMAAVMVPYDKIYDVIAKYSDTLSVAAFNGPNHTVISGDENHLEEVIEPFKAKGIKVVRLTVSHAFHSPLIEPILDKFESVAASISFYQPKIKLISNVTGEIAGKEIMTPAYWRDHIRQPVRFMESMLALQRERVGIFMEIGPKPTLLGMGRTALSDKDGLWLPSLRVGQADWEVMLSALSKLYTNGFDVNWSELYPEKSSQPVELPTYQFDRRRFWLPIPSCSGSADSTKLKYDFQRLYPLIDRKITSPLIPSILFETEFSSRSLPFLDDHRIFGSIVVSAASHLSLLCGAAGLTFTDQGCVIEDILFTQALVIPENIGRTVQLIFSPIQEVEQYDFSVISFDQEQEKQYIRHVTGRISPIPSDLRSFEARSRDNLKDNRNKDNISELNLNSNNLKDAWEKCTNIINPQDVYLFQDKRQIRLGESYRWIGSIQTGRDIAVCRFKTPDGLDINSWGLHPGLIDSCFGLMVTAAGGDPEITYIPFAIEEFRYFRKPDPTDMQAVATIRRISGNFDKLTSSDKSTISDNSNSDNSNESEKLLGDIKLYDQNGLAAEWIGLEGRRVDMTALLGGTADNSRDSKDDSLNIQNLLYEVVWELCHPSATENISAATENMLAHKTLDKEQSQSDSQWIILSDKADYAAALADSMASKGQICRWWSWDNHNSDNFGDTQTLSNKLSNDIINSIKSTSLKGVVHLITLDSVNENIESIQRKICGFTLEMVQALIQRNGGESPNDNYNTQPQLILVTCGTQTVTGQESKINPEGAALWGMGRSIALEHPDLKCTLVDIDPDRVEIDELGRELVAICQNDSSNSNSTHSGSVAYNGESQIALRNGKVYAARLKRCDLNVRSIKLEITTTNRETDMTASTPKISSENTYLITGGLGGLGLAVARWLTEKNAGCIVLVGRKEPSKEVMQEIEDLHKNGINIEIRYADMTDSEQVESMLSDVIYKLPPLKGIIHAAGLLDDGVIAQLSWEKFWHVMAPKVVGASILDKKTRDIELDFFVCFSSIVSILGTPAQANYAAANAYLDAVCRSRNIFKIKGFSKIKEKSLSINWGPFAETGMAARLDNINQRRITAQGFNLISPKSGLTALELLIGQNKPQMAVMSVDWSRFMERFQAPSSFGDDKASKPHGSMFLSDFQKFSALTSVSTSSSLSKSSAGGGAGSWQEELSRAAKHEHKSLILNRLRAATAEILGLDNPDQLDANGRLFDLGLDSLMAVELKNCVEKNLNCRLKSTLVFDYPTVASMAEYLIGTLALTKQKEISKKISIEQPQKREEPANKQPNKSHKTNKPDTPDKPNKPEKPDKDKADKPDIFLADMSDDDAEELLRQELENLLGEM